MAEPNARLIEALRQTANRLEDGAAFYWSHQGLCNCGHLAHTLTGLDQAEIHRRALMKTGDWSEHAIGWCPTSGYDIDDVISDVLLAGLTKQDLVHLEHLSDPQVLQHIPEAQANHGLLDKTNRAHAVAYLRAWSHLLEDQYVVKYNVQLPKPATPPLPIQTAKAPQGN